MRIFQSPCTVLRSYQAGPAGTGVAGRMIRMRARWVLGTALLAAVAPAAQGTAPAPGNVSIRATDLEADVRVLAGDGMRGRLTDTEGNRQAAEFISSRFARFGLSAVGSNGTHFHRFDLMTTQLGDDNRLRVPGLPPSDRQLGDEFYPDPASASGESGGAVVFVGFGIAAPSLGHDDYQTADLAGKVALMLNHEPGEFEASSRFRRRGDVGRVTVGAQDPGRAGTGRRGGAPGAGYPQPRGATRAHPADPLGLARPTAPGGTLRARELADGGADPGHPDLGHAGRTDRGGHGPFVRGAGGGRGNGTAGSPRWTSPGRGWN